MATERVPHLLKAIMKCQECKWFVMSTNDFYGLCKRYPKNENKNQADFCGEFIAKPIEVETVKPITITFEEPTKEIPKEGTYDAETGIFKPLKRTRKAKNVD